MDKFKMINRIKELYDRNENIIKYLKQVEGRSSNSIEDILISYDFQAGSYTELYKKNPSLRNEYTRYIASLFNHIGKYNSILEVGIGEGTTLGLLNYFLEEKPEKSYGFDISWSRIKYARKFMKELNVHDVELFTGDLFTYPLKDNSIDIVYTSHSIEPNGGREEEALKELYRITKDYLILLEPSYDFADEKGKERMQEHGYVTKLYSTAKELGYKVVEHRLFDVSVNPLNPTGLIVIQKNGDSEVFEPLCCPISKSDLIKESNSYFSKESLLAYPIIDEIPCLLPQNAILATKFND
jgi:SAM-dependent methyltransferase